MVESVLSVITCFVCVCWIHHCTKNVFCRYQGCKVLCAAFLNRHSNQYREGAGYMCKGILQKKYVVHHLTTSHTSSPCAGGTILSTKPPIYVLSTKNLERFCSSCVSPAPATGLKRCTQCKNVWYCNAVRPPPL